MQDLEVRGSCVCFRVPVVSHVAGAWVDISGES